VTAEQQKEAEGNTKNRGNAAERTENVTVCVFCVGWGVTVSHDDIIIDGMIKIKN
jgi:hypothetical protein